jgi:hypothetical protein
VLILKLAYVPLAADDRLQLALMGESGSRRNLSETPTRPHSIHVDPSWLNRIGVATAKLAAARADRVGFRR